MIKKFTSEIIMDNRRAKIKDLIEIEIDLDDGVKMNYAKFQGVEVAQEGKKALKIDLLAKI